MEGGGGVIPCPLSSDSSPLRTAPPLKAVVQKTSRFALRGLFFARIPYGFVLKYLNIALRGLFLARAPYVFAMKYLKFCAPRAVFAGSHYVFPMKYLKI